MEKTLNDYSGLTILATLRKKTSPQTILFLYCDEDALKVHHLRYRTLTGELLSESLIDFEKADIKLENYKNNGFEIVEDEGVYAL